ncbi:DUF6498-containing protein [Mycobacterium deserti]|uniref:DUF6498-containing protein n=1 Tax=Mycobacterium deserti TaxID=2978347 RepID=A0ABT2MFG4_9MYCO|nr:DUF6498-containing protein [Mycobacterium deserti]MCT7659850.1 DUF6498-containing protein [Mycobacterium deserti]
MPVTRLLTLLGINGVPAAGWFLEHWSAGTTLAVYWFENVAATLCIAVLIVAHRRVTPRRGHFRYQAADNKASKASSFLSGYLTVSLAFCGAHGVFLGAILFLLNHNGEGAIAAVNWRSVAIGCTIVLVLLIVDLAVDLIRVRSYSFLRVEQSAYRGLGRVVVVHLTIVFGLFLAAITGAPNALFGLFIVLKTLYALSTVLPQWEPAHPPQWLSRLMNRMPNVHPGERFEDFWTKDRAAEARRRERNEEPWTARR